MKKLITIGIIALICCAASALAVPPPVSINIQPYSLKVSFGSTIASTTNTYSLLYYYVNNTAAKIPISNFQFKKTNVSAQNQLQLDKDAPYTVLCTGMSKPIPANSGIILPNTAGGVCNVYVKVHATGNQYGGGKLLSPDTYQFSLSYGDRKTTLPSAPMRVTYATGQQIPAATRTFTFVNNCAYDVNFGIASGATNSINPDPKTSPLDLQSCINPTDCYPNSQCIPVTSTLKHCFWNNPAPIKGGYTLTKNGGNNSVTFPTYDNGVDQVWSGGVAARINCAGGVCEIGDCGAGPNGACKLGGGFAQPITTSEFTLQGTISLFEKNPGGVLPNTDGDTYDATIINGITVPISMAPTNGKWSSTNPYVCGVPGAAAPQAPLGVCAWQFNPPIPDYNWVKYVKGAQTCGSSYGCPSGQICGLAYNPTALPGSKLVKQCGVPMAPSGASYYWTADAICAADAKYNVEPFNCPQKLQGQGQTNLTYADLYGCSTGVLKNSCYTTGAQSTCCGCVNWNTIAGIIVPAPPITGSCVNHNSNWTTYSQPKLEWVKKGCPTAYTYPYDDMSSTFTCSVLNSNKVNVTNYRVTFCPKK